MGNFSFRKMRHEDKDAVCDMVRGLWDGDDYIPAVFDDWADEHTGEFAAILFDGRIVGCSKMTFLTPRDVWLEGLRSVEDFPVRGMGREVTAYFLEKLRNMPGLDSVRFATYAGNKASIISAERSGFVRTAVLSVKSREWEASETAGAAPEMELFSDPAVVFDMTKDCPYFSDCGGNIIDGWRVYPYSQPIYRDYVRKGIRLASLGASKALFGYFGDTVHFPMFDLRSAEEGAELLSGMLREAAARGVSYAETAVPDDDIVKGALKRAGFESWESEDDYYIYEYPLKRLYGGPGHEDR